MLKIFNAKPVPGERSIASSFYIMLTASLRKVSADAKVSEENTGINSTYIRLGDLADEAL